MKIKELIVKYLDAILYLFFGVCTTIANIFAYWLCAHPLALGVMPSTIIAWIVAVLLAYLTNRKWVFHSQAETVQEIVREIISFFSCRLATGIFDWLCMFIFVTQLGWNDVIMKALANVIVIILNYIASKFLIFKKK